MRFTFMSVFIAAIVTLTLSSGIAEAVELAPTLEKENSQVEFENAVLLLSSHLNLSATEHVTMFSVNHGLRKVALYGLVPVPVYVLQFLASRPQKLIHSDEGILSSLKSAGPIQLQFTMLRNLPGSKIVEAFKEGLEANKINLHHLSTELEQIFKEIQSMLDLKKGANFSVTAFWKDRQVTLLLENPNGEIKSITGSEEFATQFFSIWFGKPSDPKVKELKKDLLR